MDLISKQQKSVQFKGQKINLPLFLDHQSTTPLAPQVKQKMLEIMDVPGNAESSSHVFGIQANEIIQEAQREVAALINAHPDEIIFTSGATEANNLALHGILSLRPNTEAFLTTK
ncbi:MAG: aminotransferase class V-fold PLP-dependent enzyme, partial [Sneathiella sp.]|nr:aminotransferase class V-fold PLP-dependent enzyme [Sneathiella sp.]